MEKFKRGDKVEVNGNKEARILDKYCEGMWEVRLFDGSRHIGDICVSENDIKLNND